MSHKSILARILKRTVSEVADMDVDEISASIEGSTHSGEIPVLETPERITGDNTESVSVNESTIYYDIRFYIVIDDKIN